jgi:isopentenyl diphosphate isomerase/L-lactate dehydrogenase-like FMN-dependent dehydrogenase
MSTSAKLSRVVNIEDLRGLARSRLPSVVFDYLDGGAEDEITLRDNCNAFQRLKFKPHHAISFNDCDLRIRILDTDFALPVLLAPVGYSRIMHPEGEVGAARAAGDFGTGYILSTISGHKMEDVKAATKGPAWYQLYLLGGRSAAEASIERAKRAGFSALVVTIDTAVAGNRERDLRNGMKQLMGTSPLAKLRHSVQFITHPRWLARFLLDGGLPSLPNVVIPNKGPLPLTDVGAALANSAVTWSDFHWIRTLWGGPVIAKGVMTPDDAMRALDHGATAIVVSNHGGRQLDGVPASLDVLAEVVAAVAGRADVLMDGGIRRGSDVVKAICLGAKAVLIGRGYAYGMAAAGYAGVSVALSIFREDIERTMRLLGCCSVTTLERSLVSTAIEGVGKLASGDSPENRSDAVPL